MNEVLLVDRSPQLCEQWQRIFADAPEVHFVNGGFRDLIGTFNCFVSPASSFGLMDGGIDAALIDSLPGALRWNANGVPADDLAPSS